MRKLYVEILKGFSIIEDIRRRTDLSSSDNNYEELLNTDRMDSIIYILITNRYATYKELRDDYSLEEVIDLYECCMVNLYNKALIMEQNKRGES